MKYVISDINKDPIKQDFEDHQYDLVIASNVIHLTRSISASLKNIKKLLHSSSYLLLQKLCSASR